MSLQLTSAALIVLVTLILSLYDIVPAVNDARGDTISEVLRQWSRDWPVLAYMWGVLGGHWFLGHAAYVTGSQRGDAALLVLSGWAALILCVGLQDYTERLGLGVHAAFLLAGIAAGHFLWTQAA